MTVEDIIEAWRVNCFVNLELLNIVPESAWDAKPGKGKTIRSNFAHIVNCRSHWLQAFFPKSDASFPKLDWKSSTREQIVDALSQSDRAMAEAIRLLDAEGKKLRWTAATFFAYCVAHEAHHRSQVETALRLSGVTLDEAACFRLWEWETKAGTESPQTNAEPPKRLRYEGL